MITPHPGERQQLCPVSSSIVSFLLFSQTAGRSQHRCGNGTLNSRPVCIYCTQRACSCNPLRLSALLWPYRTSAVHSSLRQKICPFLFTYCSSSNTEITSINYRCESTTTYVKKNLQCTQYCTMCDIISISAQKDRCRKNKLLS